MATTGVDWNFSFQSHFKNKQTTIKQTEKKIQAEVSLSLKHSSQGNGHFTSPKCLPHPHCFSSQEAHQHKRWFTHFLRSFHGVEVLTRIFHSTGQCCSCAVMGSWRLTKALLNGAAVGEAQARTAPLGSLPVLQGFFPQGCLRFGTAPLNQIIWWTKWARQVI